MKIVILDGYTTNPGDLSWDRIKQFGDVTVYDRSAPEQVSKRVDNADIVITNKALVTKEVMDENPNIKLITTLATGYNAIDTAYAKQKGIPVSNVPGYSTDSVAQLVFAYILHIYNKVSELNDSVKAGGWCASEDFSYWVSGLTALKGKTIGIVGFGSIGRTVADIAAAFKMNVLYCNRRKQPLSGSAYTYADFETLLSKSDIVTLHCPLTDETKGLINKSAIDKMKQGALLINTSRGTVINEHDLAEALNNGRIYAAADVVSVEPMLKDNPLLTAKNCIITPHIGWAPRSVRESLLGIVEQNIKSFLDGSPQNVVNA